jgi:antitoxin ParD1/3/4
MQLSLPKGLEDFVRQQVDAGLYESPEEVYRDGLRLLKARRDRDALRLQDLRRELGRGIEELDRGEGTPFNPEDIIAEGKRIRG